MRFSLFSQILNCFLIMLLLFCVQLLFLVNVHAEDTTQIGLPEGAIARLGKGTTADMAISPDGKQLAVASSIGIWLYDTQTGDENALLTGHETSVRSVAFSPDGIMLASGSGLGHDRSIRLWDTRTGKHIVLSGNNDDVHTLAFSPDGLSLVSGDDKGNVILWDLTTGERKHALHGNSSQVTSVVFSPDGKTVAGASLDDKVRLWNVEDGKLIHTFIGHTDWVIALAFSPDSTTLASGGIDGAIRLWDTASGELKKTFTRQGKEIDTIAFGPDGDILAYGIHLSAKIEFLNVSTGKVEEKYQIPKGGVTRIVYSSDKKTLVSMNWSGHIYFWDLETDKVRLTIDGHTSRVRRIAYSKDGITLASTSGIGIDLWDIPSLSHKTTLKSNKSGFAYISTLLFSPDNRTIISASWKGIINFWDYTTAEHKHKLENHTMEYDSIAFSSDGRKFASVGSDQTIRLWQTDTLTEIHSLAADTKDILSVAFSPDNRTLATSESNGVVRLWDVITGENRLTIPNNWGVSSMDFSPNGILLATGGMNVQLWHTQTGEHILTLEQNPNKMIRGEVRLVAQDREEMLKVELLEFNKSIGGRQKSLVFSPNGFTLAVLHEKGVIRLWDIETQEAIQTYAGHKRNVEEIAFSPDGKTLASCSWDGTILLWDVPERK